MQSVFVHEEEFHQVATSFFLYIFLREFLLTPALLLARQKNLKLLLRYYQGICDGISFSVQV